MRVSQAEKAASLRKRLWCLEARRDIFWVRRSSSERSFQVAKARRKRTRGRKVGSAKRWSFERNLSLVKDYFKLTLLKVDSSLRRESCFYLFI
jgi:hypothetical protein